MGDRESLVGVGLILNHTGTAAWLKALYGSYRVFGGCVVISTGYMPTEFLLSIGEVR